MSSDYDGEEDRVLYLNRAGRREQAAYLRKSKVRGSNFTKPKKKRRK